MRSEIVKRILAEMPEETNVYVDLLGDFIVRVNEILSRKDFADVKEDSQITKIKLQTFKPDLKSIARLSVELGEPLLQVVKSKPKVEISDLMLQSSILSEAYTIGLELIQAGHTVLGVSEFYGEKVFIFDSIQEALEASIFTHDTMTNKLANSAWWVSKQTYFQVAIECEQQSGKQPVLILLYNKTIN